MLPPADGEGTSVRFTFSKLVQMSSGFYFGLEWGQRLTNWQLTNGLLAFIELGKGNQNATQLPLSATHAHSAHTLHATKKWWGGDWLWSHLQEDPTQQQSMFQFQADLWWIVFHFWVSEYPTRHNYSDPIRSWQSFLTVLSKAVKMKGMEQPVAVMCLGHGCWRGAFSASTGPELDRGPETCQGA